MKKLFSILFFVYSASLFSQTKEIEMLKSTDRLNSANEFIGHKGPLRFRKEYQDTLNVEVVHTNWLVFTRKSNFYLLTLAFKGKIFYREFYQQKLTEDLESWTYDVIYTNVDSLILKDVNREMRKIYERDINISHIERRYNRSTFGYACGGSATMPEEGNVMLKLMNRKDTVELSNWLRSINPIKQAYAYLGFKMLNSKFTLATNYENRKLLEQIEQSSKKIYSCKGCTFWNYETIESLLNWDDVSLFIRKGK